MTRDRMGDLGLRALRAFVAPSEREWFDAMRAEYAVVPLPHRRAFRMGFGWCVLRLILWRWAGAAQGATFAVAAGLILPLLDPHTSPDTSCRLVPLLLLSCSLLSAARPRDFLLCPIGVVLGLVTASTLKGGGFVDRGDLSSVLLLALGAAVSGYLIRRISGPRWSWPVLP